MLKTNMEPQLEVTTESEVFIQTMYNVYDLYFKHGARSNKNVDYFHNFIKCSLEKIFTDEKYKVDLEVKVKSINSTGYKKCDIVVLKHNNPYIIFPVKIIKTNYKQNKNNSWENLTGELSHIKWADPEIKIIPINILMNKTPYLDNLGKITKFENVTFDDISNYEELKKRNIVYDLINYIIDVEHKIDINNKYTETPVLSNFNSKTPFRSLYSIVKYLI